MLRALEEIGSVDVLILSSGSETKVRDAEDSRALADCTFKLWFGMNTFRPDRKLAQLLANRVRVDGYDLVCARYLGPISKLEVPHGTPVLVDLDDIAYEHGSGASGLRKAVLQLKSAVRRAMVRKTLKRFNSYWFITAGEREQYPTLRGTVLPNIPAFPRATPSFSSSGSTILMVGSLAYPPNRVGFERFYRNCWPTIQRAAPAATLRIVGWMSSDQQAQLQTDPRVQAPGFVDDLDAEYARAALVVAPVYSGGGTSIKILEAAAHGRACVTTRFRLKGLEPDFNGHSDIVATATDDEMAAVCIRLLGDPDERERLARSAYAVIGAKYTHAAFRSTIIEDVSAALRQAGKADLAAAVDTITTAARAQSAP